jgi:hypothetical protein
VRVLAPGEASRKHATIDQMYVATRVTIPTSTRQRTTDTAKEQSMRIPVLLFPPMRRKTSPGMKTPPKAYSTSFLWAYSLGGNWS